MPHHSHSNSANHPSDLPEQPVSQVSPWESSASEQFARIILDEMYQFAALLTKDGHFLAANKPALTGAGITIEDIRGTPLWQIRHWPDSRSVRTRVQNACEAAAQGAFVRFEEQVYAGNGGTELIWIDFSVKPVFDQRGSVIYLLAEGRNINEKRLADEKLRVAHDELVELNKRLRDFDEQKTQFFANISHELRTPLALILGPVQQLAKNEGLSDDSREMLLVAERNAKQLLRHVNELLDVAKLDAGKMAIRYASADLSALVRLIASNFETLADEKNISYKVITPERMHCQFDAEKMQRVCLNLLSNAFKFTPPGGAICISLTKDNGQAVIMVRDSGPGIRKENRERIFERFRQLDGGPNRKYGGTGLGLAIVKDFVTLHRGTVSIEDAPFGSGAFFIVTIPRKAPAGTKVAVDAPLNEPLIREDTEAVITEIAPQPQEPGGGQPVPKDGRPVVLVVEDNPDLNSFIQKMLADSYQVISAGNGEDGYRLARTHVPDLILSDVMMPKISGEQMIEMIREDQRLRSIPIVMLTAKADDALRVTLLAGGIQDYLVKPFSGEEIKARIHNILSIHKARKALQDELESRNQDIDTLAAQAITRTRELEEALENLNRREVQLQAIMDGSPTAIYIKNMEGTYVMVNDEYCRLFSLERPAIIGKDDFGLHPEALAAILRENDAAVIKENHSMKFEEQITVGSELRTFMSMKFPLQNQDGSPYALCGISMDITERIELERKKDDFIAAASHEMKTPVTSIKILSQVLESQLSADNEAAKYVLKMDGQVDRLTKLIDDLLDVSKIQHGQLQYVDEEVNLGDLLKEVLVDQTLLHTDHTLTYSLPSAPVYVLGDHYRLSQVLSNLLANAIKYSSSGDEIRLVMSVNDDKKTVTVAVTDTGIGIDERHHGRLFERFYRVTDETARTYPGLGMGLYIASEIIKRHHGSIAVKSSKGAGSTFSFTLPQVKEGSRQLAAVNA